jgi:hypothetical protein
MHNPDLVAQMAKDAWQRRQRYQWGSSTLVDNAKNRPDKALKFNLTGNGGGSKAPVLLSGSVRQGKPSIGRRLRAIVGLMVLASVLFSCSSKNALNSMPWERHLGIRPDEPFLGNNPTGNTACAEFTTLERYAKELQEAYHSRATQNRSWIYGAGTIALGTVAAGGALAAASAASLGTLALLSISGGFASGFFGVLDNATLADLYTIAANSVGTTLTEAQNELQPDHQGNRYGSGEVQQRACARALYTLQVGLTEAKNNLERARTDSAIAAGVRAEAQRQKLNQLLGQQQSIMVTTVVRRAQIVSIEPVCIEIGKSEKVTVTLIVTNANLKMLTFNDVRALLGPHELEVEWGLPVSEDKYHVTFKAPLKPPEEGKTSYSPVLLIRRSKERIESLPETILRYSPPPCPKSPQ